MNTISGLRWPGRRKLLPRRGPRSRLALSVPGQPQGLRFTELLVVGVFALAYLLSISQPLFGIQINRTVLSHFPLTLLAPVLVLHFMGVWVNRKTPVWSEVLGGCWPLVLLGLYALVGSAVAKWALNVPDSFLTFGVYLLLLPLYAALTAGGDRVRAWAVVLVALSVVASCAALAGELVRVQERESLHEIEYLVATGFLVLFYVSRSVALKLLALALLIGAAVINYKLTGFIIAALAVLHIGLAAGWRRLPPAWRGPYRVAAVVAVLMVGAVLALLYTQFRNYLPSGNADVRLAQYEAVWRQFLESPVWGNAFLDGSGEGYREGMRLLYIPTHSDVLDILKHGGLIALGLFAWGYWKVFAIINGAVVATRADALLCAYFTGARFFQVTALITFAINPLLLKGPFLIVIWGNLGLALGLALACLRAERGSPPP